MIDKNIVIEALSTVLDPEIGISIVDLGLIYDIDITEDDTINVTMTLTMPGCPLASRITQDAKNALSNIKDIKEVNITLTFDPPWNVDRLSESAKEKLGYK